MNTLAEEVKVFRTEGSLGGDAEESVLNHT